MAMNLGFPATTVNLASTSSLPHFYQNSIAPIPQLEPNSIWRVAPLALSFSDIDEVYKPTLVLNIGRSSWTRGDPNTYQSIPVHIWHKRHHAFQTANLINHASPPGAPLHNQGPVDDASPVADPETVPFGSNVNPLVPDPIGRVHLTPGCFVVVSYLKKEPSTLPDLASPKTSLLRNASQLISRTLIADNLSKRLQTTDALLISVNGRVLTVTTVSPQLVSPDVEDTSKAAAAATGAGLAPLNVAEVVAKVFRKEFTTLQNLELPLLRVVFSHHLISALAVFDTDSARLDIALGFTNGDIFWVDLLSDKIRYSRFNKNGKVIASSIVSMKWSHCGRWLLAGFANGEVAVFDRAADDPETYQRLIESTDKHVAVYRSIHSAHTSDGRKQGAGLSNPVVHFKLAHKSITSIAINPAHPLMVSFTSDDGSTRLVDLPLTKGPAGRLKVTDIIPGYFGGTLCSTFSPDGKFLAIGGEDDLVAVYLMSYVSLGHLLSKSLTPCMGPSQASLVQMVSGSPLALHSIMSVKLVARLEGHHSWVRDIQFDHSKCPPCDPSTPVTYRVGSVGDDGRLVFWDFNPKSVPKVKKPPVVLKSKKEKRKPHHQRQRSGELAPDPVGSCSHLLQIHQLLRSAQSTNSLTGMHAASSNMLERVEYLAHNYETVCHRHSGYGDIGYVLPVVEVPVNFGKMSGLIFDLHHDLLWGVCTSGDVIRWTKA